MAANPLFFMFGVVGGAVLLMALCLIFNKGKKVDTKSTPPVEFIGATYRYVVHRSVETNRREEANQSTNSNDHIVNISSQSEPLQQNEVSQPPPPYFRDTGLPQYVRNA